MTAGRGLALPYKSKPHRNKPERTWKVSVRVSSNHGYMCQKEVHVLRKAKRLYRRYAVSTAGIVERRVVIRSNRCELANLRVMRYECNEH
jgi:hypothetical protein